jgi:hypothetical protein
MISSLGFGWCSFLLVHFCWFVSAGSFLPVRFGRGSAGVRPGFGRFI